MLRKEKRTTSSPYLGGAMREIIILIITLLLAILAYICLKRKNNYSSQYSRFQNRNGAKMKNNSWFQKIWEGKKEVPEVNRSLINDRLTKDTDSIKKNSLTKDRLTKDRLTKDIDSIIKDRLIRDVDSTKKDVDRVMREYSGSNGARKENQLIMKQKLIEDYMEVYQKCEEYKQEENYDKLLISIVPSIQRFLGLCHYVLNKKDLLPLVPELIILLKETFACKIKEAGFLLNSSGRFVLSSIDFEVERSRLLQLSQEDIKERLKKKKAEIATIHRYNEMKKICKESAPWLYQLQIIFEQIMEQEEVLESYEELMDISEMIEQIFDQNGFQFLYYEELEEESKIAKSFRNLNDSTYSYPALCKNMERIGYQIYLNLTGCNKEI